VCDSQLEGRGRFRNIQEQFLSNGFLWACFEEVTPGILGHWSTWNCESCSHVKWKSWSGSGITCYYSCCCSGPASHEHANQWWPRMQTVQLSWGLSLWQQLSLQAWSHRYVHMVLMVTLLAQTVLLHLALIRSPLQGPNLHIAFRLTCITMFCTSCNSFCAHDENCSKMFLGWDLMHADDRDLGQPVSALGSKTKPCTKFFRWIMIPPK